MGISVSFAPAFVRHVLYLKKTLEIRAQYVLYIFPLGILGILNFHFFFGFHRLNKLRWGKCVRMGEAFVYETKSKDFFRLLIQIKKNIIICCHSFQLEGNSILWSMNSVSILSFLTDRMLLKYIDDRHLHLVVQYRPN